MLSIVATVISLPESADRRANLLPSLARVPHLVVEAVRGSSLPPDEIRRAMPTRYSPRVMRGLTLGEVGCTLSHLKAIALFLESNHTHALVLEDDASLTGESLAVLRAILDRHGEIDILKLGGFGPFTARGRLVERIGAVALLQALTFGVCSHAYALSRPAAERIASSALPIREPYDTFLRNRHRHGCRIFETSPWLVGLQPNFAASTIGAREAERSSWPRLVQAACVRAHATAASRISNAWDFGPAALVAPSRFPRFPSGP